MDRALSKRNAWQWAVLAVLVAACIELVALAAHRVAFGEWFSPGRFAEMKRTVTETGGDAGGAMRPPSGVEAIHPFVGYVYDPARNDDDRTAFHRMPISPYGFLDDGTALQKKSPEMFVVGVFGGSVAYWLSIRGETELIATLSGHPAVAGREVVLVRHALGGYKQPQQMLALAYHLALGAEYDLILNLDGFNEVALPPVENVPLGVFPHYPRNWSLRVGALEDVHTSTALGELQTLKQRRIRLAEWASLAPGRISPLANLLWRLRDRALTADLAAHERQLPRRRVAQGSHQLRGPSIAYDTEAALTAELVRMWAACSRQMAGLAAANGATYLHFLQPNQYVADSKPMTAAERKRAVRVDQPYRAGAIAGYPLLRAAGAELAASGIAFHDLTLVFRATKQPVYEDDCCHLNDAGNAILARAIGAAAVRQLSQPR